MFTGKMVILALSVIFATVGRAPASAQSAARPAFVMISGYGDYPAIDDPRDPAGAAVDKALRDIAKHKVSGIVYGTLGVSSVIRARRGFSLDGDPNDYNKRLFALAKRDGANIWLQLRYYDDVVTLPSGPAELTAPEITADASGRAAFLSGAMAAIAIYHDAFPQSCTIILGEEETPHHSKMSGGLFWSGHAVWNDPDNVREGNNHAEFLKNKPEFETNFVAQFVDINRMLITEIRKRYPGCKVGIHIGHEPLTKDIDGAPIYQRIIEQIPPIDFTFYDMYQKISKDDADYSRELTKRIGLLKQLKQTVYYLAQIHTTGNFGSGGGRTPSAAEIDRTYDLAMQLGVDGFGWYTKNTLPTMCMRSTIDRGYWQDPENPSHRVSTAGCNPREDLDPLDPNREAKKPVYQDALQRWNYGLAKLDKFLGAQ